MSDGKIELDEKLDQRSSLALLETLKSLVGQPVVLDTDRVRFLGGQCAQVLIAAVRKWSADGIDFSIEASEKFQCIVRNLGLEDELFLSETQI